MSVDPRFHPKMRVAVALVHYPIVDKAGNKVCTNITNFDVHDIARACRTYGVEKYYLVNPMREQLMFASRMIDHWRTGYAAGYNAMRSQALSLIKCVETVDDAQSDWSESSLLIATSARELGKPRLGVARLKELLSDPGRQALLVFGTGFGLHEEILERCDYLLDALKGGAADDYRHLSVRSAVSIYLDRLLGQ